MGDPRERLVRRLTGHERRGRGNSTARVGTPETVAKALSAYYEIGAISLLIRG